MNGFQLRLLSVDMNGLLNEHRPVLALESRLITTLWFTLWNGTSAIRLMLWRLVLIWCMSVAGNLSVRLLYSLRRKELGNDAITV